MRTTIGTVLVLVLGLPGCSSDEPSEGTPGSGGAHDVFTNDDGLSCMVGKEQGTLIQRTVCCREPDETAFQPYGCYKAIAISCVNAAGDCVVYPDDDPDLVGVCDPGM